VPRGCGYEGTTCPGEANRCGGKEEGIGMKNGITKRVPESEKNGGGSKGSPDKRGPITDFAGEGVGPENLREKAFTQQGSKGTGKIWRWEYHGTDADEKRMTREKKKKLSFGGTVLRGVDGKEQRIYRGPIKALQKQQQPLILEGRECGERRRWGGGSSKYSYPTPSQ